MKKTRVPLAYQILGLQVCIVLASALVGIVVAVLEARSELDRQYEQRSLAIAQAVASTSSLQQAVLLRDAATIQQTAEAVERSTGATYVVVTDSAGIRFSHPNPALIGKQVDEDPSPVLAGRTWVGLQKGTLGDAARGKAPIFYRGRVIGMVSVGFLETTVASQLRNEIPAYAVTILLVLGLGAAGSVLLARWLKRQIFGLEPYEIVGLLEEREASLLGIGEGAIATDGEGRITLVNDEARRLLALPAECVGKKISQVVPPGRVFDFLSGRLRDDDEVLLAGERVLVASRRPVRIRDREVGRVVTLRDSTELRTLSGGLGVDRLTDALRAQAHEFSNRLHVIAGLVELGRGEEAMRLISEISGEHQNLSETLLDRMGDPVLGALLLAKAAVASERGVELRVAEETQLPHSTLESDDLITLVGNLVDNAIDSAAASAERLVEVLVAIEEGELVIQVRDSGPGVPPELAERIFTEGFSTKSRNDGRRRGIGLALVRKVARRYGGDVGVANQGGAAFTVRLPLRVPLTA